MKSENEETQKPEQVEPLVRGPQLALDFDSDAPLVCNRDQAGDKPCESCQ